MQNKSLDEQTLEEFLENEIEDEHIRFIISRRASVLRAVSRYNYTAKENPCPVCNGSGIKDHSVKAKCWICGGTAHCHHCHGSGVRHGPLVTPISKEEFFGAWLNSQAKGESELTKEEILKLKDEM